MMEKKYSLTLDKEFIQYCKINDIKDVEKHAKMVFSRGFAIFKYGDKIPSVPRPLIEGNTKSNVKNPTGHKKASPPPPPKHKKEKKDLLYDE